MWEPSTSASVMITIFPYLKFSIWKGSNPVPNALIKVMISLEDSILAKTFFFSEESFFCWTYVFKILPLNGRTAWNSLFLACLADPPAESPSTIKSSAISLSFVWQSANFPGKLVISKALFLLTLSLAFLATSLATAACIIFPIIIFVSFWCWSNHIDSCSLAIVSTTGRTSDDTSFSLVWDENFGSGTFADNTQINPSLTSSPEIATFSFLAKPLSVTYLLISLVMALRNPSKCVPPSFWGMLFVKHITCSL